MTDLDEIIQLFFEFIGLGFMSELRNLSDQTFDFLVVSTFGIYLEPNQVPEHVNLLEYVLLLWLAFQS